VCNLFERQSFGRRPDIRHNTLESIWSEQIKTMTLKERMSLGSTVDYTTASSNLIVILGGSPGPLGEADSGTIFCPSQR
jgi:hypothetical protein